MLTGRLQDVLFDAAEGQAIHCEVQEHLDWMVASQRGQEESSLPLSIPPPSPPDISFPAGCKMHEYDGYVDTMSTATSSFCNSPCTSRGAVEMPSSFAAPLSPLSATAAAAATMGHVVAEDATQAGGGDQKGGTGSLDAETLEQQRLARVIQLATVYQEYGAAVVAAKSTEIGAAAEATSPEELAVVSWKHENDGQSSEPGTPHVAMAEDNLAEDNLAEDNDASAELAIAATNVASEAENAATGATWARMRRADKWQDGAAAGSAVLPLLNVAIEESVQWRGLPPAEGAEGVCLTEGRHGSADADAVVHLYAPWQVPPGEGSPDHVAAVILADLGERGGVRLKLSAEPVEAELVERVNEHFEALPCENTVTAIEGPCLDADVKGSCKFAEFPSEDDAHRMDSRDADMILSGAQSLQVYERQLSQVSQRGYGDLEPVRSDRSDVEPVAVHLAHELVKQASMGSQGAAHITTSRGTATASHAGMQIPNAAPSHGEDLQVEPMLSCVMTMGAESDAQGMMQGAGVEGGVERPEGVWDGVQATGGLLHAEHTPDVSESQTKAGVSTAQQGPHAESAQHARHGMMERAVAATEEWKEGAIAGLMGRGGGKSGSFQRDAPDGEEDSDVCTQSERSDLSSVASTAQQSSVTGAIAETAVIGDTELLDEWPSRHTSVGNVAGNDAMPQLTVRVPRKDLVSGPSLSESGALSGALTVSGGQSDRLAVSALLVPRTVSSVSSSTRVHESAPPTPHRHRTRAQPGSCGVSRATEIARMRRGLAPDFSELPDDHGSDEQAAFQVALAALCTRNGEEHDEEDSLSQSLTSPCTSCPSSASREAPDAMEYLTDSQESASNALALISHVVSSASTTSTRKLATIKRAPQPGAARAVGGTSHGTSALSPSDAANDSAPYSLQDIERDLQSSSITGHDGADADALGTHIPFSVPPGSADETQRWVVRHSDSDASDGDADCEREPGLPSAKVMMAAAAAEAAALAAAARWNGKHASGMPSAVPRLTPSEAKRQAKLKQASLGPKVGQHVKSFEKEMRKLLRSGSANGAARGGDASPAESDDSFMSSR
jgi:hypothetical protein